MDNPTALDSEKGKPTITEMQELFEQTPMDVWRDYADNGYLWYQMVMEEFSTL